jgi:hypothetical protein
MELFRPYFSKEEKEANIGKIIKPTLLYLLSYSDMK